MITARTDRPRQTEYSLGMFFTALKAINGSEQSASKGKTAKKPGNRIQNNKVFREMYQNTQDLIESGGEHPKFAKVIQLVSTVTSAGLPPSN